MVAGFTGSGATRGGWIWAGQAEAAWLASSVRIWACQGLSSSVTPMLVMSLSEVGYISLPAISHLRLSIVPNKGGPGESNGVSCAEQYSGASRRLDVI